MPRCVAAVMQPIAGGQSVMRNPRPQYTGDVKAHVRHGEQTIFGPALRLA